MEKLPNEFYELYFSLPRQGPGCEEATRRALATIAALPDKPLILDVGCGTGAQSLDVARLTGGTVLAVDNHLPFLSELKRRAGCCGQDGQVLPVVGSMFELPFPDEMFDLIWSEGAIYIMGFEAGLQAWRRLLRPGSFLAVSELTWLRPDAPPEVQQFLEADYPGLGSLEDNLARLARQGYMSLGHFTLPEEAWWTDFYGPLAKRLEPFREKYANRPEVLQIADAAEAEIALYRHYAEYYGYVFYIMQQKA